MVSVSDLTTYIYCKRKFWLSRKAMIEDAKRDFDSKVKFNLLRLITSLIDSKTKICSFTDFIKNSLPNIPGEIVGTEVPLEREKLFGRIDVLRKTKDGYIIQEEKMYDPPDGNGVWPGDKLQIDAYAFLAETLSSPLISGVIIYNDLIPRKVNLDPERAREILEAVTKLLESNVLPEAERNINKCLSCSYYPLCQVLPEKGGLTETQIRNGFTVQDRDRTTFLLNHEQT